MLIILTEQKKSRPPRPNVLPKDLSKSKQKPQHTHIIRPLDTETLYVQHRGACTSAYDTSRHETRV